VEGQRCEIVLPRWLYIAAAILIAGYVVYWLRDAHSTEFSGRERHRSSKSSGSKDLQIEEPVSCW
jgi:high-affinity Fe2+/Pb2+ permease